MLRPAEVVRHGGDDLQAGCFRLDGLGEEGQRCQVFAVDVQRVEDRHHLGGQTLQLGGPALLGVLW